MRVCVVGLTRSCVVYSGRKDHASLAEYLSAVYCKAPQMAAAYNIPAIVEKQNIHRVIHALVCLCNPMNSVTKCPTASQRGLNRTL